MAKITAIIDIGSNSARMAIFERTSRFGFNLLKEIKSRVRISEDSYENEGYLQPVPMERAYMALKEFQRLAQDYKAGKILCVATSAMRDAPNSNELVNRVKKELGISIKVIEGEKEAFYGAVAASNLLNVSEGLTVDIGGGSTELAQIIDGKIHKLFSLNLGTVRIKELFYDQKRGVHEARAFIEYELQRLPQALIGETIIGIGGTIRALARAVMKETGYPIDLLHGFEFSIARSIEMIEAIAESPVMRLKKYPIKKERYDTIREGALIFSMILRRYTSQSVITSGVGVREGVFLSDMLRSQNHRFPPGFNPSVRSLQDRFCQNGKFAEFQKKTVLQLFDVLRPEHKLDEKYKFHLQMAAKLSNIGKALNFYDHHKHGSYFLLNSLHYQFTHQDKQLIALLVEYHNKKIPNNSRISDVQSLLPDLAVIQWLSFLLGLAEALNLSHVYPEFSFTYTHETLTVYSDEELYLAREAVKKLAKPIPLAVIFKTSPEVEEG